MHLLARILTGVLVALFVIVFIAWQHWTLILLLVLLYVFREQIERTVRLLTGD